MTQTNAPLDASVIICTFNRADSLYDTLCAVQRQETHPERNWEVIVVDNNSNDHTRSVVEAVQGEWPLLRYTFEANQGLSHARNHGIALAKGQVILFTDDDVLPEADWVETTLNGLVRYDADACGGYIAPIWETPPPNWLNERFYGFLAIRTERQDDFVIQAHRDLPFGANMAFKHDVFDRVGTFDVRRGRMGQALFGGEDLDMFERLLAAGFKVVFLGRSRVHHKVESYRLKKQYFRRWRRQTSRNIAMSKGVIGDRRLLNVPLYMIPQFGRALWRAIQARLFLTEDEVLHRDMIVNHFVGTFQGLLAFRNKTHG